LNANGTFGQIIKISPVSSSTGDGLVPAGAMEIVVRGGMIWKKSFWPMKRRP